MFCFNVPQWYFITLGLYFFYIQIGVVQLIYRLPTYVCQPIRCPLLEDDDEEIETEDEDEDEDMDTDEDSNAGNTNLQDDDNSNENGDAGNDNGNEAEDQNRNEVNSDCDSYLLHFFLHCFLNVRWPF